MNSKISLCIITRGEPSLEAAIASFAPHVDEVCIVATTADEDALESVRQIAPGAIVDSFTACLDPMGQMGNFAIARTRSLRRAKGDAIVWADSDDTLRGGEHLRDAVEKLLAAGPNARLVAPYEYAHDPRTGDCTVLHYRERAVRNDGKWTWKGRVHENLVRVDGERPQDVIDERVVWVHGAKSAEDAKRSNERNLRILDAQRWEVGDENLDARTLLHMGNEYALCGDAAEAVLFYGRYLALAPWEALVNDEKVRVLLRKAELLGPTPAAREALIEALMMAPQSFESNYGAARHFLLAAAMGEKGVARQAVLHTALAIQSPEEKTVYETDPTARGSKVYAVLGAALAYQRAEGGGTITASDIARECRHPHLDLLALEEREDADLSPDIVFACLPTPEAWDPARAERLGIGGSETALIEVARGLRERGAHVRVYATVAQQGLYDGVEYRPLELLAEVGECDLLVAWRDASLLEFVRARVKWLWVHDVLPHNASDWNLHLADRILGVSEWHAGKLREKYPEFAGKVHATRNGIDWVLFEGGQSHEQRVGYTSNVLVEGDSRWRRVVYTQSPDRGLEELLDCWPRILELVPDAELRVFYGKLPHEIAMKARQPGVEVCGRVNKERLAKELRAAGVWAYPAWMKDRDFLDTSCIGIREALAAGCAVVTRRVGALQKIASHTKRGVELVLFVDETAEVTTRAEWLDCFAGAVVSALKTSMATSEVERFERSKSVADWTWPGVVTQWNAWLLEDTLHRAETATALLTEANFRSSVVAEPSDKRPLVYFALTKEASGGVVMNAREGAGSEAMGGGSRTGFLGLVRAVGALGKYRVRAFSTFRESLVEQDGVEYVRIDQWGAYTNRPDAMLAFYDTGPLRWAERGVLRIASHHTYEPYRDFEWADVHTAPSAHALGSLRARFAPDKPWHVLPNGIPVPRGTRVPRVGRVIYHTSLDRGLHWLFAAWPEIRARVPGATLHVVGPVRKVLSQERVDGRWGERVWALRGALESAERARGVELLGRLTRVELDRELMEASCFAFPADLLAPSETFSISVGECCAIGLPVVLIPQDALGEVWQGGVKMSAPSRFASDVVSVLTDPAEAALLGERGKRRAARYTFEAEATVLARIIDEHLARWSIVECEARMHAV